MNKQIKDNSLTNITKMVPISELFKILSQNETFDLYCQDLKKSNAVIIAEALLNDELKNILQYSDSDVDMTLVKTKMEVIINQKRKANNKCKITEDVRSVENKVTSDEPEHINNTNSDPIEKFSFKPINPENVVMLNDFAYIERVDYKMRLVTSEYEMYY